ncbi:hypothetical protein KJ707_00010 [Patescibacteria group bacterium]|nr:hypothetical protein [Patescibacteria group bacterium]MBU2542941.1 hypothetical protein [Patescibacteria group bacterium]
MTDYSKQELATKYLWLKDMATTLQYGELPNDRRVQLKIPAAVVKEIDLAFPNITRSKLFTQLALEALQRKYRYGDPDLSLLAQEEQHDLDQMWHYLEERDGSAIMSMMEGGRDKEHNGGGRDAK